MTSLGHGAYVMPITDVLPPQLRQVWRWFLHLHTLRDHSRLTEPVSMPDGRLGWRVEAKAMPLSPERIDTWSRMARVEIEPWQFAALTLIDQFYVKTRNDPPPLMVAASGENLLSMFRALGMKAKNK